MFHEVPWSMTWLSRLIFGNLVFMTLDSLICCCLQISFSAISFDSAAILACFLPVFWCFLIPNLLAVKFGHFLILVQQRMSCIVFIDFSILSSFVMVVLFCRVGAISAEPPAVHVPLSAPVMHWSQYHRTPYRSSFFMLLTSAFCKSADYE